MGWRKRDRNNGKRQRAKDRGGKYQKLLIDRLEKRRDQERTARDVFAAAVR